MESSCHLRSVGRRKPQGHRDTETKNLKGRPPWGKLAKAFLCASVPLWFSVCGCSYASARLSDLGDIVRLEGHLGYGLQAHANAGEIVHFGVGSSRQWSAGWIYGGVVRDTSIEEHFPLTIVYTLMNPDQAQVHRITLGTGGSGGTHRCMLLFPALVNPGTVEKEDIHFMDFEVGVLAGVVGFDAGFSLLEFVDFLLGLFRFSDSWTFLDPANDDGPAALENRPLWIPRRKSDGVIPNRPH
jgi:hypothetical protein